MLHWLWSNLPSLILWQTLNNVIISRAPLLSLYICLILWKMAHNISQILYLRDFAPRLDLSPVLFFKLLLTDYLRQINWWITSIIWPILISQFLLFSFTVFQSFFWGKVLIPLLQNSWLGQLHGGKGKEAWYGYNTLVSIEKMWFNGICKLWSWIYSKTDYSCKSQYIQNCQASLLTLCLKINLHKTSY